MPRGFETLAEHLSLAGYHTGAIANHIFLGRRYQLDQGYADYDDELALLFTEREASHVAVTSEIVTDKALDWLEEQASAPTPWHLWLHYFDPHHRYQPHPELPTDFGQATPEDLYDGEIAYTDQHLGRLFDYLDQTGLFENTVIDIVSDHGEEFQDHGGVFHRRTLYEEVLRVPLIIKVPGLPSGRVSTSVSLVDVAPTLLELAGLAASNEHDGTSLVPALRGESMPPRAHGAHLIEPKIKLEALIHGNWKLIRYRRQDRTLLFNLASDPGERTDLAPTQGRLVSSMLRAMAELRNAPSSQVGTDRDEAPIPLNSADLSALESLGYGGEDEEDKKDDN
ncbi:MAG: choline-sulfatase [Planctomycetota bacterium]|jgi:choline-sulfatase